MEREQEYVGTIRKCPNCGAELQSFTGICPSCGHELNDNRVNDSVKDFFLRLEAVASNKNENEIQSLIENYVVPNNKESILEFFVLAASLLKTNVNPFSPSGRRNARFNEMWKTKLNQLSMKAKIILASDPDGVSKIAMIQKEVDSANAKAKKAKIGVIAAVVVAVAIIIGVGAFSIVDRKGAFIEVPKETFISTENITLTGSLSKYLKLDGDGVMIYCDEVQAPTVIGKIAVNSDVIAEIDRQYKEFLSSKKWKKEDCSKKIWWGTCLFDDRAGSFSFDLESENRNFKIIINSLSKEYFRTWSNPIGTNKTEKDYKQALKAFMDAKIHAIDLDLRVGITNQRIKNEVVKSEDYDWLTNSKDEQYGAGFKVK